MHEAMRAERCAVDVGGKEQTKEEVGVSKSRRVGDDEERRRMIRRK